MLAAGAGGAVELAEEVLVYGEGVLVYGRVGRKALTRLCLHFSCNEVSFIQNFIIFVNPASL